MPRGELSEKPNVNGMLKRSKNNGSERKKQHSD
jgi:hypothetical protein